MARLDLEELAEIELQRDEEEAAALGAVRRPSAVAAADQDPALSLSHPFYDVARHGILQVGGLDRLGRRIVTFSCCRVPPSHELDHRRLLEYLRHTLDRQVEGAYAVVYFHFGLSRQNRPSLRWLQGAYRELDRRHKKSLQALYIVHPTSFVRVLWTVLTPLISHKFGKKVAYFSSLSALLEHLQCDRLAVPPEVRREAPEPAGGPAARSRQDAAAAAPAAHPAVRRQPAVPPRQKPRRAHPPGAEVHGDVPAGERGWRAPRGREGCQHRPGGPPGPAPGPGAGGAAPTGPSDLSARPSPVSSPGARWGHGRDWRSWAERSRWGPVCRGPPAAPGGGTGGGGAPVSGRGSSRLSARRAPHRGPVPEVGQRPDRPRGPAALQPREARGLRCLRGRPHRRRRPEGLPAGAAAAAAHRPRLRAGPRQHQCPGRASSTR